MHQKNRERREAILEAARGILLERGYEAASMAAVSARLGGSKGTLYNYFASKEALFAAVMLEKVAPPLDPLYARFCTGKLAPAALEAFAVDLLRLTCRAEFLAVQRMIYVDGARSDLGRLFIESGAKAGWRRMAEHFHRAMEDGRMRPVDPWVAVAQLHGLCRAGPYERLLSGEVESVSEEDLVRAAHAAVEAFVRAYDVQAKMSAPSRSLVCER